MARHVLLIEPDVDTLGQLAEQLRARGLSVSLASDATTTALQAHNQQLNMVFVAAALTSDNDMNEVLATPDLILVPRLTLVRAPSSAGLPSDYAAYDDVDWLVKRVLEARSASAPPESEHQDLRGDLQQVSLVDLLQLLALNRRTGILTLSTQTGAGQLTIAEGEVLDAVYRRMEGEKAIVRLLSEKKGSFLFSPGTPSALARVTKSTSAMLMDAIRQQDEFLRLRTQLALDDQALMAAGEGPTGEPLSLTRQVWNFLQTPRTIDELLDELPALDLEILRALDELLKADLVRGADRLSQQIPLATGEQLPVLRALVGRLGKKGFSGPPRILFVMSSARTTAFVHALGSIAGMTPPAVPAPTIPIPYDAGMLRLGENVVLALSVLPLVEAFAPLWTLALPGVDALVNIEPRRSSMIEVASRAMELPILEATSLVQAFEFNNAAHLAQLLRSVIEHDAKM